MSNRKEKRAIKKAGGSGSDSEGEGSGSETTPTKGKRRGGGGGGDDLSEFQQPAKVDPANAGLYVGLALLVSAAPAYLYTTVYDLPVADFGFGYLVSVVLSTGLLSLAYHIICTYNYAVLANQRKAHSLNNRLQKELGLSGQKLDEISRNITARESLLYALIFNNVVYFALFFFTAFYLLKEVSTNWNYLLAQCSTAALTYYIATAFSK
jgi:predicted permease